MSPDVEEQRTPRGGAYVEPPFYMKCLDCGDVYEHHELIDAEHGARYHSGYHGGLHGEDVEIVVTNRCGVELFRIHSIVEADSTTKPVCESCGEGYNEMERVSCPHCGHIPEEARA